MYANLFSLTIKCSSANTCFYTILSKFLTSEESEYPSLWNCSSSCIIFLKLCLLWALKMLRPRKAQVFKGYICSKFTDGLLCYLWALYNYMWYCVSQGGVAVYRYIIIEMFQGAFLNAYYYLFLSVCAITSRAKIKFLGIDLDFSQNPCSWEHLFW